MSKFWLYLVFLAIFGLCQGSVLDNRTSDNDVGERNASSNPQAWCYDSRISSFLNYALSNYYHDMGALSKYILDQITYARYRGSWLVHSEIIWNRRQGIEWQSLTNGDLFSQASKHGCYFHDAQTFVLIVKY